MTKKDKCKLDYKYEHKHDHCKKDDYKKNDDYKKMYQQMHDMMGHMYCGLCKSLHHTVFAMMQHMCMSPMMMGMANHQPNMPMGCGAMPDMCMMPCMPMPMMPCTPCTPTTTEPAKPPVTPAPKPEEVVTKPDDFFFHVNMPEIPPTLCLPGVELEEKKKMG